MGEPWVPRAPAPAPATPPEPRRCAVPDCGAALDAGLLMCLAHWRMVPRPLQNEVYRTFRERQRTSVRPYEPHLQACRKAVEAVVAQL